LCVQGPEAGAHRGTFSAARGAGAPGPPVRRLLANVAAVTSLPLIAAGAIMSRQDVTSALAAGAVAVQVHFATRPMRAAAAAAGDTERMNLWAGEGYRAATTRPAAKVVALLSGGTG
jgi:nitronate monooxygenase